MSLPNEFFISTAANGRRNRLANSLLNGPTSSAPEILFSIPCLVFIYELYSPRFFIAPTEETFVVENNSQMSAWYYGTEDVTMCFASQSFGIMQLQGTFEVSELGSYTGVSMLVEERELSLSIRRRITRGRLLVWNCRGLIHDEAAFRSRFSDLCTEYRPNVVLITETRLPEHLGRASWIAPFPSSNLFRIAPENGVGGMWLMWRTSVTVNIERTIHGFNATISQVI